MKRSKIGSKRIEKPTLPQPPPQSVCSAHDWCVALDKVMTEANRKGINPVVVTKLSTGRSRVAGVAFKQTNQDRGVMLNFCPFCGTRFDADVIPQLDAEP